MMPFFIFYSMFGFQRVGDLAWAFGDARGRGFLIGATAGRTTLQGEGLQHDDGHSHVLASVIQPGAYDPAYAYELAVIVEDGLRWRGERMLYYLGLNENYPQPAMPEGVEDGIVRGLYRVRRADGEFAHRVQLLGSGPLLREALRAADLLAATHDVGADVWSVTSYQQLRADALQSSGGTVSSADRSGCPTSRRAGADGRSDRRHRTGCDWSLDGGPLPPAGREFVALGTDGYGRRTPAQRCAATSRRRRAPDRRRLAALAR
jgi:pyruvate dehydrogenase E1 component